MVVENKLGDKEVVPNLIASRDRQGPDYRTRGWRRQRIADRTASVRCDVYQVADTAPVPSGTEL
jgi:predicted nucleic acid binding AN1-type Zn finger protein